MNEQIVERRRLLQLFTLGSLALPAVVLAGCASGSAPTQPRRYGGGNRGGEKSGGGNGGTAGGGNR
jgi:hypothetical protein